MVDFAFEKKDKVDIDLLKLEAKSNLVADLSSGVYDGAISRPIRAISQMVGAESKSGPSGEKQFADNQNTNKTSAAHRVGEIAGSVLPFIAVSTVTKAGSVKLLGAHTAGTSSLRIGAEQGVAGLAMGALLTPSDLKSGESLFSARLKQGGTDFAVFASMGGSNRYLSTHSTEASGTLAKLGQRLAIGAGSGALGGFVDAELRSGFKANSIELATSVLGYAAFGALMEGGNVLGKAAIERMSQVPKVEGLSRQTAVDMLASDPKTTVISSPAGLYDKLDAAIRKAPKDHTIVVAEQKWANEAQGILKSAKRSDITIVVDKPSTPAVQAASAVESKTLNVKEMSRGDLAQHLREEAAKYGVKAEDAIIEALKRDRVVMIGEYHVPGSAHNEWGAELMPKLKGKATHLALENGVDSKLFDGQKVIFENLPPRHQHHEYASLLNSAKRSGLEVSPVDVPENASRQMLFRNQHMADQITKILEDPKARVLFWVGNQHLRTAPKLEDGPQVVSMLRDRGVSVSTFYGQHDNFWREEPVRHLFTPRSPIAVPTKDAPVLRNMNWLHPDQEGHSLHKFSEMDFVLMHPEKRSPHFD